MEFIKKLFSTISITTFNYFSAATTVCMNKINSFFNAFYSDNDFTIDNVLDLVLGMFGLMTIFMLLVVALNVAAAAITIALATFLPVGVASFIAAFFVMITFRLWLHTQGFNRSRRPAF